MSEFDDELIATRTAHLSGPGESIKYKPGGVGGRTITAFVNRRPSEGLDVPFGHSPFAEIHVENDSTTGIDSDEINTKADMIEYAVRLGEAVEDRKIVEIIHQDAGMLILDVR